GKGAIFGLELLQAGDIRRGFIQPSEEVRQTLVDVVDVEGGDFHTQRSAHRRRSAAASSFFARATYLRTVRAVFGFPHALPPCSALSRDGACRPGSRGDAPRQQYRAASGSAERLHGAADRKGARAYQIAEGIFDRSLRAG